MRCLWILLLFAAAAFGATIKLYMKDGTYQLAREYEVKQDRLRFYSTERDEWEEIPVEMVDLARTKKEISDREAEVKADQKATAEEDAALESAARAVEKVPKSEGVYFIHGDNLEPIKEAESKLVGDKRRTVLQVLSPLPTITGRRTVELDGVAASLRIDEKRPEFYIRLSQDERFGIIKLTLKKDARVVETVELAPMTKEISEKHDDIPTFRKQEGDALFKIWPEGDLEPGEYALVQYTENKVNMQVWDFGIGPAKATADKPKKSK